MKKVMILAAAIIFAGLAQVQAQTTEAFPSHIQVTGEAQLEIEPNEIYVSITINETESKTKITVAEQERKMIAALKKLGIDTDKNLQVGDMRGDLKKYVIRKDKDKVQTSKSYILKVDSADLLARIFDSLADINITKMRINKATRNDLPELKMKLRGEAIIAARQNAEALAGAIGQSIGKAFQITDYNSLGSETMYVNDMYNSYSADIFLSVEEVPDQNNLSFKNLNLIYRVDAHFVLE